MWVFFELHQILLKFIKDGALLGVVDMEARGKVWNLLSRSLLFRYDGKTEMQNVEVHGFSAL